MSVLYPYMNKQAKIKVFLGSLFIIIIKFFKDYYFIIYFIFYYKYLNDNIF